MKREVSVWALGAAAAWLAAGCSLLGLDRFTFPGCVEGRCDALNARDGFGPAACELWVCASDGQTCTFGGRDLDGDGFISDQCVIDEVRGLDCDDSVREAHPGASEICNAADDDCNGLVDDGTPERAAAETVVSNGPLGGPTSGDPWTSYAPATGGLALATEVAGNAVLAAIVLDPVPVEHDQPLLLVTTEPIDLNEPETEPGCARYVATAIPTPRVCVTDAECMAPPATSATRCVTGPAGERFCEVPVVERLPAPAAEDCTTHWACDDGDVCNGAETCEPRSPASDANGCRPSMADACAGDARCDPDARTCVSSSNEVCSVLTAALAPVGAREWMAAVTASSGCAEGTLRFGHFVLEPDIGPTTRFPIGEITARATDLRSTSWLGIDTAADGCGGDSRGPGAPRGVAGVGLASLPADDDAGRLRPQALAAWLAAPTCRSAGSCASGTPGGTGPVDVEAIGVWLEEGAAGGGRPIAWPEATGSGVPTALGVTADGDARSVAVASWLAPAPGYVLAYPLEPGGIAVHVLPQLGNPAPPCDGATLPCLVVEPPHTTQLPPEPAMGPADPRTSDDLEVPVGSTIYASAAATGSVAVAVREDAATVRALLAWPEASVVVIATADLHADGTVDEGDIVAMVPSTGAREVAVTHVASGIALVDRVVGGMAVTAATAGGFVVVWRDDGGVRGVRVSDHTGEVVGAPARLGDDASSPMPFLGTSGRPRVVGRRDEDLVVFPAVCGP